MKRHTLNAALPTLILLALILPQTGCDKNSKAVMPDGQDFIMFGYVFGECGGDCRELFLITADGVFRDAGQVVEFKNTVFQDTPMSDTAFLEASKLWAIPKSLRKNKVKSEDLKQTIADVDYYIYGEIANSEFEIIYDQIDSTTNRELFEYSLIVAEVITNIR